LELTIDLVPESSWGQNLRLLLGRTRWDKLRKQILGEQGNVCAVCGAAEKLQCHEVWEFNDETGVQLLRGFQATCNLCHFASHFGLAQRLADQGHLNLDNVIEHFLKVNGVTMEQFRRHKTDAFALWRKRSEREWTLDFGQWASLLPDA
jgi:hypothetical protein